METLVIEVMQKRLEREINDVLRHLELHVRAIEFDYKDSLSMVINLESTDSGADLVS
ncbi:MAG: hypothetical protein PHC69_02270 [Ruminiclostridium sp.]|nr:hypothetical protein [Ruminiclostridium sp.]